jgi:hypothetical protein
VVLEPALLCFRLGEGLLEFGVSGLADGMVSLIQACGPLHCLFEHVRRHARTKKPSQPLRATITT